MERVLGEVSFRVVNLDPTPGGVGQLGKPRVREGPLRIAHAREREGHRAMRLQCFLDSANHVVATEFAAQAQVAAQYRPGTHVQQNQYPDPLNFKLVFSTERGFQHHFQAQIQAMTVELDNIERE